MGILSYLLDALSDPKGPVYTLKELEDHWKDYRACIINITESTSEIIARKPLDEIVKCHKVEGDIGNLCDRIRWRWLNTITGWMNDEFIPKIRTFSHPYVPTRKDTRPTWVLSSAQVGGDPSCNIHNNLKTAKERASHIIAALSFFLCDERSPFEIHRSLDNGECTAFQIRDWYVGGLRIVENNISRIENAVQSIITKGY